MPRSSFDKLRVSGAGADFGHVNLRNHVLAGLFRKGGHPGLGEPAEKVPVIRVLLHGPGWIEGIYLPGRGSRAPHHGSPASDPYPKLALLDLDDLARDRGGGPAEPSDGLEDQLSSLGDQATVGIGRAGGGNRLAFTWNNGRKCLRRLWFRWYGWRRLGRRF